MGPILELIQRNFKRQLYPFQDVVIDESLILFKGRLHFKQYIKSKRHRFGIKLFVLCDCETAYILNFDVYVGKENEKSVNQEGFGLSGAVVVNLLEPYLNKGHSFYSDNYYTSPALSTYLHKHKTNSCGTVRSNRKKMPKFEKKLKKGETEFRSSEHMLALKWKDRREVFMLSTMHENKMVTLPKKDRITGENIKKPLCVVDYNRKMGAVDKTDMMISSLDCTRKTIKWYKKLFMHILDLCLLNAHALYLTQHEKTVPYPKFHLEIIHQLFDSNSNFLRDIRRVYPGVGKVPMKLRYEDILNCDCHECEPKILKLTSGPIKKTQKRKEITELRHSMLLTGGGFMIKVVSDPVMALIEDTAPAMDIITIDNPWDSMASFEVKKYGDRRPEEEVVTK
ncbi:hypothetical protein NQ318_022521 [Aromia moschata]|uniref:PiggyBac transposable element-derived protein domain-containing protein n=1 Tax=Aromia moschata TaxID=1265417 RepID=A0AAV8XKH9_9CUCU|nr:hypothetical protein NQ318_022521 [Aromia moschata]